MRESARTALKEALHRATVPTRLVQELRREVGLFGVRVRRRFDPVWRSRERAIARGDDLKLHLGCGSRYLPGWVNVDAMARTRVDLRCDIREPLPLREGSCRVVYMDRVLDAIEYEFRLPLLRELHRVLKPAGTARFGVPNCARFAQAYVRDDREWFLRATGESTRGTGMNGIFYGHFHRYIDDFDTLSRQLREAGFREVVESAHRQSAVEDLRVDTIAADRLAANLYVDATK